MKRSLRVLVIGWGSPQPEFVTNVLRSNGFYAERKGARILELVPNPFVIRRFDVIYGMYLHTCGYYLLAAKVLGKKAVVHFVGSDAYRLARSSSLKKAFWTLILRTFDVRLYVSQHLQRLVGARGFVLPFPIATDDFRSRSLGHVRPDRDVLYYCPGGRDAAETYRLDWITDYAARHPDEKVTIIGSATQPALYDVHLPNVEVIPYVPRSQMPFLYRKHKMLIRTTSQDGFPKMIHEALLCGLTVIFNGKEIKSVPEAREPSNFATAFRKIIYTLSNVNDLSELTKS